MRQLLTLIIFACFLFSSRSSFAQYWAQGIGGGNVDETMDICNDNAGNIISAGYFTNTSHFGWNTTLTSTTIGVPDAFISKSSSTGITTWAVKAGGSGSDRAVSVAADALGNIYITGYYYGSAAFGTTILTSVNGSKDAFIAKLDASGNFVWAVSAGGNLADMGNAIAVDQQGNIVVTGQFEGNATFGATSFTSMTNPNLNIPSIDVFTTKFDNNGNFLWTRTGSAEFTDRGLDIVANTNGEIYVCGQFSDTITFNQVHNNPVMNAIFLIKYDAAGNEMWLRRASGTYSIAYSIALNSSQDIFMTGDYQGTLAFYGSPNNFLNDNYSKRIFLAKFNNSGTFQWASSISSDNYISAKNIGIDVTGDAYVYGEYGCTLNDFADIHGQGTFNSIGFQDLFVVKYNSSGQKQWERNFGGPKNDKAHGILVSAPDKPTIAGSYDSRILWPVNSLNVTTNNPYYPVQYNNSYCNDPSYGTYFGLDGRGFSDGFLAYAIDISRAPYDYYYRTGASCLRGFVGGCIEDRYTTAPYSCVDSLKFCEKGFLLANTFTGVLDSIGPYYRYQWSSAAADTFHIDTIYNTNTYSVIMTTLDGCYSSQDTVYAEVNPRPFPPTITDDHGRNNNHPKYALNIDVCMPDTVLLITGNHNPSDTVKWYQGWYSANNPPIAANDSVYVTNPTGYFYTVVSNLYGCTDTNRVHISFDNPLPPLVPKVNMPDTMAVCANTPYLYHVYDSLTDPTGQNPVPLNYVNSMWTSNPPGLFAASPDTTKLYADFIAANPGTITYDVMQTIYYHNACGVDTFYMHDTITLVVSPVPQGQITISGSGEMCPGDTVQLAVAITGTLWSTVQTVANPLPPFLTVTQPGTYTGSVTFTDTVSGCWSIDTARHSIQYKIDPEINTVPGNALICPNDSVQMTCNTAGYDYQWIGPNGILPDSTQTIYATTPGFYHCIVLDMDSCVLTSTTTELKQYNTPYIIATPGNVVCLGQSVTLQVITNDTTLIQWTAPLSGGGTQQTVTQTGTYTCNVTMCGITTVCSVQVVASQATAQITAPSQLCPGDSAWITANSGMAAYQWSTGQTADSIYVAAGAFILTSFDANGCFAGDTVQIALDTSVAAPVASAVVVCSGDSASLVATANGPVEWYTSSAGGLPVFSGNPFVTQPITTATTFYAATYDTTGCHSLRTPVGVGISPASLPPAIFGDTLVCYGNNVALSGDTVANATYSWTGPNGFTSSQMDIIVNADTSSSGTYTLVISDNNCTSPPASVNVQVIIPPSPMLVYDSAVCEGTVIQISDTSGMQNATYQWAGPNGPLGSNSFVYLSPADTSMSGMYSVFVTIGACMSNVVTANIIVNPSGPAAAVTGNIILCEGDTLSLQGTAPGAASYLWITPNGTDTAQNIIIPNAYPGTSGSYLLSALSSAGCPGTPASVFVTVNALPVFSLGNDTTVCEESSFMIPGPSGYSSYLWNDNSTSSSNLADTTGTYTLTVTDANGCSASDDIYMDVVTCAAQRVNVFSPNGDGVNDNFTITGKGIKNINVKVYNRYGSLEHEWNDPAGYWDGTNTTTGEHVPSGTYFYVALVETIDGKLSELTGHVFLTR